MTQQTGKNLTFLRDGHRTKPAVKREHIARTLRRRIVEGLYPPGGRLPLRTELEKHFNSSPVTVQRALDRLAEDGFVCARGRGGTYVADHPPHLACYALVFPTRPDGIGWNRFWTAMCNEAHRIEESGPRRVRIYHDIDENVDKPTHRALIANVQADRLAGIILAFYPEALEGTPLLTAPNLPRVVVCEQEWPSLPVATFDSRGLIDKALDHFARRGCRRIALLSLEALIDSYERHFAAGVESRGMVTRPYWIQAVPHSPPKWAQKCAHLLMHGYQTERPDAILIADDNLVEPVTAGLIAAGLRSPEDIELVGHCNFPWPTPSHLPITRLGYDIRQFFLHCIGSIDSQRCGDQQPSVVLAKPQFESEIPPDPTG